MASGTGRWAWSALIINVLALLSTSSAQVLQGLPADVEGAICRQYLPERDLVSVSAVSRSWRDAFRASVFQIMLPKLPKFDTDDQASSLVGVLNGMRDEDLHSLRAALDALKLCPKIDVLATILRALGEGCIRVKTCKAAIQTLYRRVAIQPIFLVAAFFRAQSRKMGTHARVQCLGRSVVAQIPLDDPIRQRLPRLENVKDLLADPLYAEAREVTWEMWVLADDAKKESLILHGIDYSMLMRALPAMEIVRLYRQFGLVPDEEEMRLIPWSTRLDIAVQLIQLDDDVPPTIPLRFMNFRDLVQFRCGAALTFAQRFHHLTTAPRLPDDIVNTVLRCCPDDVTKQLLPLIVTNHLLPHNMMISSRFFAISDHFELFTRLRNVFFPGTPLLNAIIDYVGASISVLRNLNRLRRLLMTRLPLQARFQSLVVMLRLFEYVVSSSNPVTFPWESDSLGRTSLHALAEVMISTGWSISYNTIFQRILEVSVNLRGSRAAAKFLCQKDHQARTFLDIAVRSSNDFVKLFAAHHTPIPDREFKVLFTWLTLPSAVNRLGQTVLHHTLFYLYCLPRMPREFVLSRPELLDTRDNDGQSVLHVAVSSSCHEAVEWFVGARPNLTLAVDGSGRSVLHDIGSNCGSQQFLSALLCVPISSNDALRLVTLRDHNGRTALDVALSKGEAGRHHQEILFDLHHRLAEIHKDVLFLYLLQTPEGQMHRNSANGKTAVHQAYDIIRRNDFGIGPLIDYMILNPCNWASNLDLAGNTILHAVYQHEPAHSDVQFVTDAMEQMMSPKEWRDVLAVTNAAGRRPYDVLRSRIVHLPASRELQFLLDAWRDSQGEQNGTASGASSRAPPVGPTREGQVHSRPVGCPLPK
ncbi:Uncharacterized protein PBTT_07776 [Plasmodiophora brassicae]